MNTNIIDDIIKAELSGDCWVTILPGKFKSSTATQEDLKNLLNDSVELSDCVNFFNEWEINIKHIRVKNSHNEFSLILIIKTDEYLSISGSFNLDIIEKVDKPLEYILSTIISHIKQIKKPKTNEKEKGN